MFKATAARKAAFAGLLSHSQLAATVERLQEQGQVLGHGRDVVAVRYVEGGREESGREGVLAPAEVQALHEQGFTLQVKGWRVGRSRGGVEGR